jgi:hypothetical protein
MPPPPPALPTHGRPSQTVDRVGDATLPVGGTVDFGQDEMFIDLLWWIRR